MITYSSRESSLYVDNWAIYIVHQIIKGMDLRNLTQISGDYIYLRQD